MNKDDIDSMLSRTSKKATLTCPKCGDSDLGVIQSPYGKVYHPFCRKCQLRIRVDKALSAVLRQACEISRSDVKQEIRDLLEIPHRGMG